MKIELDLTKEEAELLVVFTAEAFLQASQEAIAKRDPQSSALLTMVHVLHEKVRAAVLPGVPDMIKTMAEAAP